MTWVIGGGGGGCSGGGGGGGGAEIGLGGILLDIDRFLFITTSFLMFSELPLITGLIFVTAR